MNRKLIKKHAVMMEYVIVAVLIAAAVVVAVMVFGRTVKDEFNVASTSMVNANTAATDQQKARDNINKKTKKADTHTSTMQGYKLDE